MIKVLLTISICSLMLFSPLMSYAEWDKDIPLATDDWTEFPTDSQANNLALDGLLSQYPKGINLSYSSGSTVTASTGGVVCSNAAGTVRKFRNNTATTDITFADIDTGTEANDTYYVYANCDAVATTATFVVSLSATTPTGVTSYKRIGSFENVAGDIEQVRNDNQGTKVAYGTIADGGTISLPDGFTSDQCAWMTSIGSISSSDTQAKGLKSLDFTCNSSRVCQADVVTQNWVDGSTNYTFTGTGNYIIVCAK